MTQWFKGLKLVFFNPISLGYTLASAFIFGSLISYISTAQQVFQVLYNKGAQFPIYFGCLALTVGLASLVNAKFVMTFGMNYLIKRALNTFASGSILFFIFSYFRNSPPPFWLLMTFLGTMFFCVGMLFGNFNTLALEPHGKIAGMASAMIGSVQTFISVALGGVIGQSYNGTVIPLVGGFMVLGILAYISVSLAEKTRTIITST